MGSYPCASASAWVQPPSSSGSRVTEEKGFKGKDSRGLDRRFLIIIAALLSLRAKRSNPVQKRDGHALRARNDWYDNFVVCIPAMRTGTLNFSAGP
jgi:hypothetical protein